MKIQSVFDPKFSIYGRVLKELPLESFLIVLEETTERPDDEVIYIPSDKNLESHALYQVLQDHVYGGMPIQIGYCNGSNTKLNCMEYHRDSEINIGVQDFILLVAEQQKMDESFRLSTDAVEAFHVPAGTAVELYATTLHYAPCDAKKGVGFRVAVVLPRGTNTQVPCNDPLFLEDRLLRAKNKWLIAHEDASEAQDGAFVGLIGWNIDIASSIGKE